MAESTTAEEADSLRLTMLEDEAAIVGQDIALDARKAMRADMSARSKDSASYQVKTRFKTVAERKVFFGVMMRSFHQEIKRDEDGLPEQLPPVQ